MITSTINTDTSTQLQLIEELQSLRKGSGLTTWKLEKCTALLAAIAAYLSVEEVELTTVQAYEHLLTVFDDLGDSIEARATRNAYGLEIKHTARKLSERRSDYAKQLARHPDTIEKYENRGIVEIAQILSRPAHPNSAGRTTLHSKASTDVAKRMLSQGLESVYNLGDRAPEILKNFEGGRQPFLEANVELRLRPSERGSDWFSYCLRYVFTARLHTFRIGVTTDTHDTEILLASGLVDDVMQLNHSQDLSKDADILISNTIFSAIDTREGAHHQLPFTALSQSEHQQHARDLWQLRADSFKIYSVDIPQTNQVDYPVRYELIQRCDLSAKDPYAFWYSPCLMYLNNLIVDTSEFQPDSTTRFIVQPFLGSLIPGTLDATERTLTIAARGWIMQGNGLAILWTDK